jgi:hypothetical protein
MASMKRWIRRFKIFVFLMTLIVVGTILALPPVLSGDWGRQRLEEVLSRKLPVPVQLGRVDFGWLSGLVVEGVALGDGEDAIRARKLVARPELLSLLGDEIRLHRIEIEGLELLVVRDAAGGITLPGWPEPEEEQPEPEGPVRVPKLTGEIALLDATITLRDETVDATTKLAGLDLEVVLEAGAESIPVKLAIREPGLGFEGEVTLLDGDLLREDPSVEGKLRLDGLALSIAEPYLPPETLARLRGSLDGTVELRAGTDGVRAKSELALADLDLAGPALDRPVRPPARIGVSGEVELVDGRLVARDLELALGGQRISVARLEARGGSMSGGGLRADLDVDSFRDLLPGLLPPDLAGRFRIEGDIASGETIEAKLVVRAEALRAPGVPAEIGELPVRVRSEATWDPGTSRLKLRDLVLERGESRVEGEASLAVDRREVVVSLAGDIRAEELRDLLEAPVAGDLRPGAAQFELAARAVEGADGWEVHVASSRLEAENLTLSGQGKMWLEPLTAQASVEIAGRPSALPFRIAALDDVPGDASADLDVEIAKGEFGVRLAARLEEPRGRAILPAAPELGPTLGVQGAIRGALDLSELATDGLVVTSRSARVEIESLRVDRPLSDDRSGQARLRWGGNLLLGEDRPFDGRARGEGVVDISFQGTSAVVELETDLHDLELLRPGQPDIREVELKLRAGLELDETGVRRARHVTLRAPDLEVNVEGPLDDPTADPLGDVKITVRGDLARLRRYLPPDSPFTARGPAELVVNAQLGRDTISARGRVTGRRFSFGDVEDLERVEIDFEGSVPRLGGTIDLRRLDVKAPDLTAEIVGRLDPEARPPRFTGTARVEGLVEAIPAALLPEGFEGRGRCELRVDLDGTAARLEAQARELRLEGVPGLGRLEEESISVEAALDLPEGDRPLRIRDPRIGAPWGEIALRGDIVAGGRMGVDLEADVDLRPFLDGHRALVGEDLRGRGRARVRMTLAGDPSEPTSLRGGGTADIDSLAVPGYTFEGSRLRLALANGVLDVGELTTTLNGGPARIVGAIDLREKEPALRGTIEGKELGVLGEMEPQARYVNPLFAVASELQGKATVNGEFEARGTSSEAIRRSLRARADVRIDDGRIVGSPLLSTVLTLLNRARGTAALAFTDARASLRIEGGTVHADDVRLVTSEFDIRLKGTTSLTSDAIRYTLRLKLPREDKRLAPWLRVLDPEGYLPLRLGGTLKAPSLEPPPAEEVGRNLLEDLLRRALEEGGGKKKGR